MEPSDAGRVHFIGIGGAGMSAIAKVLLERGRAVSGSDLKRSRAAAMLQATGAEISIGHDAALVEGADIVVVSSAIPGSNPELRAARAAGTSVLSRGEMLAAILRESRAIVVAGTHGKTTTTSMIVAALTAAGRDPTYLVGGELNDAGTNARSGGDDLAVAESDESDGSFLLLKPHIAVVTNVESDHMEHWGSFAALRDAFERFVAGVDARGAAVLPGSEQTLIDTARARGLRVLTFGDDGDVSARDVTLSGDGSTFALVTPDATADVEIHTPGAHNVSNALAAAAACVVAGVRLQDVARGLRGYAGVERRFQKRGRAGGVTVIDDYAHHPTEVRATLAAARAGPWDRVVAVFQPHRYSRTAAFRREFGVAFGDADRIVVTDVYAAGEEPVPGVNGKLIADAVCESFPGRPVAYLPRRDELVSFLASSVRPGDAVLTLGAGDVYSVGEEVLARLGNGP